VALSITPKTVDKEDDFTAVLTLYTASSTVNGFPL
jgi:hypothetical protein